MSTITTPTADLRTNRDFYLFINRMTREEGAPVRSLEDYLLALWRAGAAQRELGALPLPVFAGMLEAALREPAPPFDPSWADALDRDARGGEDDDDSEAGDEPAGFPAWEAAICAQVVDLHEMRRAGTLDDDMRCYGVNAPRGARWYNFDPRGYLECATAGSFGGWCEGDEGDRQYVPGEVVVLDEDGEFTTADPREIEEPVAELPPLTWDDFARFLRMGQYYE